MSKPSDGRTWVGRPEIQKFFGALHGQRATKGVFITTSSFSKEAIAYADGVTPRVILVDGKELALLMIEHGVGVAVSREYEIKRLDLDYFVVDDEEAPAAPAGPALAGSANVDAAGAMTQPPADT